MAYPVSPLAVPLPEMPPVAGVRLGVAEAGIRYTARPDLTAMVVTEGSTAAGAFTRNRCPGAPVDWCRAALHETGGRARAVVVNAGNANVFTGRAGREATVATAAAAAALAGCAPAEVLLASTGTIGDKLPYERITAALPDLFANLHEDAWADAARGIMTTDTFPKAATRATRIGDADVRINGIAKGSGMIAPDMATMLCFVCTDAAIPSPLLARMLSRGIKRSFNRITVDSDTSTSDTVLLIATGRARHERLHAHDRKPLREFRRALESLLLDLALQVVRDGEGAQKLIRVDVRGATSRKSAHRVAMSIANSPLVKTAVAGSDANWGRIVMAVGKSGEKTDRDRLGVAIGGTWIARDGDQVPSYDEAPVSQHMRGREVHIEVELGLGDGDATVWTCDLTHGYIEINGSYRS